MSAVLLTYAQVCVIVGFCENTVRKWVKNGEFPEPLYFGDDVRFLASEIEAWILDRANSRGKKQANSKRLEPSLKKEVLETY